MRLIVIRPKLGGAMFYGCRRHPQCRVTVQANEDGSPVSLPGNDELAGLRRQAHQAFDRFWKNKLMSRDSAYRMLARTFKLTEEEAHFSMFTAEQCLRAIEFWEKCDPGVPRKHKNRFRPAERRHRRVKQQLRDDEGRDHDEDGLGGGAFMKLILSLDHLFCGVAVRKATGLVVCTCGCGKVIGTVHIRCLEIGICPFIVLVIKLPSSISQEGA